MFDRYRVFNLIFAFGLGLNSSAALAASAERAEDYYPNNSLRLAEITDQRADLQFQIEGFERREIFRGGVRFDQLSVEGETPAGREGFPSLPSVVRWILLPPRSGYDIRIHNVRSRVEGGINPVPVQPAAYYDTDGQSALTITDAASAASLALDDAPRSDGFWPPEIARVGSPSIMRGYRLAPVFVNPVRWNPETGEMQVIESFDLEIDFSSLENRVNLVENPGRRMNSRAVHAMVSSVVLNPPPPLRDTDLPGGSILYVTPNRDDVVETIEPLVEWRRSMGWTVEVARVAQNGNTQAIKNVILEAYNDWENPVEYVCLVADAPHLGGNDYTLAYYNMQQGAAFPYESDNGFAELEGNDILPDVALGRFSYNTINMLRGIVNKTIAYESDPYIGDDEDDRGWQERGAVCAVDQRSGLSSIDVCRWTRELWLRNDFDEVPELYWTNLNPPENQWIPDQITNGISFFLFRGYLWMGRYGGARFNDLDNLRNGRMLPFMVIATCNTGDYGEHISGDFYHSERMVYNPNGGAIGAVGAAGATHTAWNNIYCADIMRAPFVEGIYSQGWAHQRGKFGLYTHYFNRGDVNHEENNNMEAWLTHFYIYNLIGDPAVDLFTRVPTALEITHSEALRAGETSVEIQVTDADEEPIVGALVCLYKSGEFQLARRSATDGTASFTLDPAWTEDGAVNLTVSGHNLTTYTAEIDVEAAEIFFGVGAWEIDDDEEGESLGDGDGTANPTERLELTLDIANYGDEVPDGALIATLTAASPELEVVSGDAEFEAAPEAGEAVSATFVVQIGGGFPHRGNAVFNLEAQVGEEIWSSSITIPVEGPQLDFAGLDWEDEPLRPANSAEMIVTLHNSGEKATPELTGHLISFTRLVTTPEGESVHFAAIDPGEDGEAGGAVRISAHPFHLGGQRADLAMVLTAENGFQDTAFFSIIVDQARDGQPFGPDNYGYICFDDTDVDWFAHPEFEWVEIDPDHGEIEGIDTELRDQPQGNGSTDDSDIFDLPFPFQYYGEVFEQVTICSNGWMAMGAHPDLITARNRRIPGGEVVSGMLAPFWDDLLTTNDGGVYYWFDEEGHRFIVEWSRMKRLGPRGNNEASETFQVILLDPQFHPSFTGDGDIIFQYLDVTDERSCFQAWDTPFATVGIGSPDNGDGLEYTYWNVLHPGAAPLEDERAIKFSTMINFDVGVARGRVIDVRSGEGIEDVLISTTFGFWALTDSSGFYSIPDMLVDTTRAYIFTATKQFYNDSTLTDLRLVPDDTLAVNFGLLHPEFSLDFDGIEVYIQNENQNDFAVPLVNSGNGQLDFTSQFDFRGADRRDDLFDPFLVINVTQAVIGYEFEIDSLSGDTLDIDTLRLGNTRVLGATFIDSLFYFTGGGDEDDQIPAKLYRFTRNGEYLDTRNQPWNHDWGLRGITTDGVHIWGGNDDGFIYKLNVEGEVLDSIEVPNGIGVVRDVALDRQDHVIYTTDITRPIYALDTLGNVLGEWNPRFDGNPLRKYGLAWYPDQPDSLKLLIWANLQNVENAQLFGFDPTNGYLRHLVSLNEFRNDSPNGLDVSDRWNSSVWTMFAVHRNTGQGGARVTVYELEPNTTWLSYSPSEGSLQAGESDTLKIRVMSGVRPWDRYWVTLHYEFNAEPGFRDIPIIMHVVEQSGVEDEIHNPERFSLHQNYPNPFNPTTTIAYQLDKAGIVKVSIWDVQGRQLGVIYEGYLTAGAHQLSFDASRMPSGVYIYHLDAAGRTLTRKMVVMR